MTESEGMSTSSSSTSTAINIKCSDEDAVLPDKMQGNKSRDSKEEPHTSSVPADDKTHPEVVVTEERESIPGPIVEINRFTKFLESLGKFQQYLLILYNAAYRLQHSLKVLIPQNSGENISPEPKIESTMVSSKISKALSNSQISFDNNNSKPAIIYEKGNEKQDTIVSITNALSYPSSIDTTTSSDASIARDSETTKSRLVSCYRLSKYLGIFLALLASICMSVVTLVVKYMEGYSPVSKVVWRLQGVLFPSLFIVLYVKYYQKRPLITWKSSPDGGPLRGVHWKWQIFILLVLRGLIGCSADIFQYYSLKYLPLADSTVISFSTPIFVCIVAHFILGEKCGIVPIFTAVLTLCGVIVISKPPILTGEEEMNSTVLLGNILAILCMVSGTFTTVIMRYLQNVHFAMTMLALGIFGTIEGLIVTVFTTPFEFPDLSSHWDWILAACIAGLFFFGQLSMTLALQREEAGVVSLVRTCDVLFAFIWQVHFLQQDANMLSYIGAVIVTFGVGITALRKWLSELPEHSPIRTRLFFILR